MKATSFNFFKVAFSTAVVAGSLSGAAALGQSTNAPAARPDFSAFKLVTDRNIFDPTRRGTTSNYRTRETSRPRRTEYVTLVGTMNYEEKGPLAFFDGSASAYRKVLKPSESIAGYTVAEVGTALVKLTTPSNELSLAVGMQLRKDEDGAWHVSEAPSTSFESSERSYSSSSSSSSSYSTRYSRPPTFSPTATPAPTAMVFTNGDPNMPQFDPNAPPPMTMNGEPPQEFADTNAPPEAAPSSGGDADSVVQRMMQRRAQELNR